MATTHLKDVFSRLSQHSVDSVQSGISFSDLDDYMHVERPIELRLLEKINEIDSVGGGIILLVGSAGDGKSHLISKIKPVSDWSNNCFYNDATASSSPHKTAIDTLKEALVDYKDANINLTARKLVLAINLGKLNAFIEDPEVQTEYSQLVAAAWPIFDDDDTTPPIESDRIKFILFNDEQIFEYKIDDTSTYPVHSVFFSSILRKITAEVDKNPFYTAYCKDIEEGVSDIEPLRLNYELLRIPEVQDTICMTIIEAIVKYKLIITPREFLDFIYSIMVYPQYDEYKSKRDFFDALLPTLLYCGGDNHIQKAIANLDPLKHSSTDHDTQLSVLFTSYSIPTSYFNPQILGELPLRLVERTNEFYSNNGKDIERTTKFVFRLKHLVSYHSEDDVYKSYLSILKGIFKGDKLKMQEIYNVVSKAIPRHYGSYYNKPNMIPLNIQGGQYRLFASQTLKPEPIKSVYSSDNPSKFQLRFDMSWKFPSGNVTLRLDYPLFSYLFELNRGKLALSYENEKDLAFSRFIRQLIEKCDCEQDLTVVRFDATEIKLSESSFGNIQFEW